MSNLQGLGFYSLDFTKFSLYEVLDVVKSHDFIPSFLYEGFRKV